MCKKLRPHPTSPGLGQFLGPTNPGVGSPFFHGALFLSGCSLKSEAPLLELSTDALDRLPHLDWIFFSFPHCSLIFNPAGF